VDLDSSNIQGNIVPGFNKDHQAFVLVRFRTGECGREWLAALQPEIASAKEVEAFNVLFKSLRDRRPEDPAHRDRGSLHTISATWVNLAISYNGLRLLPGATNVARFPTSFSTNRIPATDLSAPARDVHALVIVAADQTHDLDTELTRQRARMAACGVDEITAFRGDTLPGDQRGREHFGFKDAISQPRIVGTNSGTGPPVAAGEFILGQPDQTGQASGGGLPEWTRNGSFLAFLQLQQHVSTFRSAMHQHAQHLGVQPDDLATWMIGRKRDAAGTLVDNPPSFFSHIGRGYSRWLPPAEALRHRVLRRGVPYGPPLPEGEPDDGQRGLLFVTYQADIARQFEHVWAKWLNGPDVPVPGAGRDALVGQGVGQRPASIPRPGQKGGSISLKLPTFVTPRYGGYFFAPSIDALSALAASAHPRPVRPGYEAS
jgi:Dyp-type peroxidase family